MIGIIHCQHSCLAVDARLMAHIVEADHGAGFVHPTLIEMAAVSALIEPFEKGSFNIL